MSQLRTGMMRVIADLPEADQPARDAIDKLLDLDLAIIQDAYATQRLRLERDHERRMGEIRFRKLVEAATVAVLIFDKQGRIAYVSPFAEQLSGYSTDELMGQSFARLLIAGKQQSAINLEKVITGNNDCRDLDLIFVTRSGEQRRWLCNLNGIDDVNGQPAMLMVAHDTTEWHATQERLGRSERLAGIGQMVAGLAHESRNALQRIGSMAEMLELECASNETALALITRLSQAQDDLRRMFDELRNYAAPIHLELEDCHVASCWHEAWELVKPLRGGRQVEWIERIECGDATVLADRFRLVQVLRNLIENAMIACGDDAQIEVVAIESSAVPGGFELRIGDNGPGIANEHRERIFEPFFTTRTKGSGLGLAIARRVIDAHGGTIAAGKSRLGGAEIGITLPPGAERP
jgi:PAS domain S-box-containing protein